uniref:Uncharacterized protein n=1 Tax=Arundo donax TaxID=35708 RepID=A0A0A8YGA1_ARUDO
MASRSAPLRRRQLRRRR